MPLTLLFGLLWLAGVLVLALLVSRRGAAARPGCCASRSRYGRPRTRWPCCCSPTSSSAAVIALVVAATRGQAAETLAVILLGLPNLVWLALTIGLGATWDGRVEGPFGLPMPHVLDEVLRAKDTARLDLGRSPSTTAGSGGSSWSTRSCCWPRRS